MGDLRPNPGSLSSELPALCLPSYGPVRSVERSGRSNERGKRPLSIFGRLIAVE
jgi:hypothetical protein